MPNIKSAKKRMKTSEKARLANQSVKSRVATSRRSLYEAIAAGDQGKANELFPKYCSALDLAAKKDVLKANAASRRKSRAAARVAGMSA